MKRLWDSPFRIEVQISWVLIRGHSTSMWKKVTALGRSSDRISAPWPVRNIARFDKLPVGYVCGLQPKIIAEVSTPINNQPTELIMTTTLRASNIVIFVASVAGAILLAGCAGMTSANTESLLSAAGFRVRTPQTPKQQQIYAALPPYQVERATVKGHVFYVYKDEKTGVAYVGREQEYQRYQQLAIQQQLAHDRIIAAEMVKQAAFNWYGGFGIF